MKLKHKIFAVLMFAVCAVNAQSFQWKSNDMHVSTKPGTSENLAVMSEISWTSPRLEFTNSTETRVEIEATIASEFPIRSILITVGDNITNEIRGSKSVAVQSGSTTQNIKQPIVLAEGSNFVDVEVENNTGAKTSSRRFIRVGKDAISDAIAMDRKDYALLIATDKYDNWGDLVNPVSDATMIASELKTRFGFEVETIENPTQDEILVKIREYAQRKYKPQDQLLVFFAGHGIFDDAFGEGYVVARNSLENDRAKSSYISHSNLRSYLNNIPCEHILLAMDVCFGGTFDPVIARTRGADNYQDISQNDFLVRKLSYRTRKYITSGGKEYVSDGIPGKNSPFAAKIIESFRSNGGEDGILTMSEILSYLEKIKTNEPRSGNFGDGEKSADFVFVAKK